MTHSDDHHPPLRIARSGLPLRFRLFIPFAIILVALGIIATYGAARLFEETVTQTADERLLATQEVLFREFKRQEILLATYASFLQHFQSLTEQFAGKSEVGILQDSLFGTLEQAGISVTFYPVEITPLLPNKSMASLFEQVRRSHQPRFRYSNELSEVPILMVAAPVFSQGALDQILLLTTEMGATFLYKVADPLHVRVALIDLSGQVVVSSHQNVSPGILTPEHFSALGRGERLSMTVNESFGTLHRHMVSAIPLGTSDLIFLLAETSLDRTADTQYQWGLSMVALVIGTLLLGLIICFKMVDSLTRPLKQLNTYIDDLAMGRTVDRLFFNRNDELGQVCQSFNKMLDKLDENYRERAAGDIEQSLTLEKARHEAALEHQKAENHRTQQELHSLQREISVIYQLNQAMTTATEINVLFDRILQVINEYLLCDHLILLTYNRGESALEVVRTAGIDFDILRNIRFTFDQGITGEAAQSQRLIHVPNLEEDSRSLSYHGQIVTRGAMVSVPLVVKGRLCGVMNLHKRAIDSFPASELKMIQAVANQAAISIDNYQLLEKTRNLSNTDELTGLSNRRQFQEFLKREVAQARRFSSYFSVIMCEIDQFRMFGETYGKIRAEALLRQVGQLLLKNTRGIDLVCRFGSSQFAILLPRTDGEGAKSAAEKLREKVLCQEFDFGGAVTTELSVTMSFGISQFPNDSKNIYELLSLADQAMSAAQKTGSNQAVAWGDSKGVVVTK
ncbi:MAG: diguanylate cyclase [Desulfuromonadales bacterium]|nr:diguanylate cyclase [Desulfuromonadales bacterium]